MRSPYRARPVPDTLLSMPSPAVCTKLYGGPQTGRIAGRFAGRRVDGTFSRSGGCEIARYDRVEPVLAVAGATSP